MRAWLLTNTTYGTWLPGDPRGSVTSVRDRRSGEDKSPTRMEHDIPGDVYEEAIPALQHSAAQSMMGPPIYLDSDKAMRVLAQFQETAENRDWTLRAVAIMANHFHIVVQVPDDPSPGR